MWTLDALTIAAWLAQGIGEETDRVRELRSPLQLDAAFSQALSELADAPTRVLEEP